MTRRWLRAPLLAVTLIFVLPAVAMGAKNTLSNGAVSPPSGTTATTFAFTVQYQGAAATVTASVAGVTVSMIPVPGSATGTLRGTASLPVGFWQVIFVADATTGKNDRLIGPTVTVTSSATPRPTVPPTPIPTPPPTARPMPTPIPTTGTPPVTATPLPPTPLPTVSSSPAGSGSPGASGFIGGFIRIPAPTSTPDAAPALEGTAVGDETWTLVTGGLIALSAMALLGMAGILRARGHEPVDQPIGPADYRPPTGDE